VYFLVALAQTHFEPATALHILFLPYVYHPFYVVVVSLSATLALAITVTLDWPTIG